MATLALLRPRCFLILMPLAWGLAFPVVSHFTHHFDETVIVLMVPVLGTVLWRGWWEVRRTAWWKYVLYIALVFLAMAAAQRYVAGILTGRVRWVEVFWGTYFFIAWRMAWGVWKRTVGQLGQPYVRCLRRKLFGGRGLEPLVRPCFPRLAFAAGMAWLLRLGSAVLVFLPLAFGSLIHHFKIGNLPPSDYHVNLPIQNVTFRTADGLTLSGWFMPDSSSDTSVLICHGLGANKGNFIQYVRLFHGRGYSALIFDFRGHGDSDGHTSTFGIEETADVRAAVDWLKREHPAQARHVYGLGSSMGAMTLARTAAQDSRIEAVVLDSCFVSAPFFARHHLGGLPVIGSPPTDLALASMSLHAGHSLWHRAFRPVRFF